MEAAEYTQWKSESKIALYAESTDWSKAVSRVSTVIKGFRGAMDGLAFSEPSI
jgi:hypothetical protein